MRQKRSTIYMRYTCVRSCALVRVRAHGGGVGGGGDWWLWGGGGGGYVNRSSTKWLKIRSLPVLPRLQRSPRPLVETRSLTNPWLQVRTLNNRLWIVQLHYLFVRRVRFCANFRLVIVHSRALALSADGRHIIEVEVILAPLHQLHGRVVNGQSPKRLIQCLN